MIAALRARRVINCFGIYSLVLVYRPTSSAEPPEGGCRQDCLPRPTQDFSNRAAFPPKIAALSLSETSSARIVFSICGMLPIWWG